MNVTYFDVEAICGLRYNNLNDKCFDMVSEYLKTPVALMIWESSGNIARGICFSMMRSKNN